MEVILWEPSPTFNFATVSWSSLCGWYARQSSKVIALILNDALSSEYVLRSNVIVISIGYEKAVMAFLLKLFNQYCQLSINFFSFICLMTRKKNLHSLAGPVAAGGKTVMHLRV
jgi:hypothetical protein